MWKTLTQSLLAFSLAGSALTACGQTTSIETTRAWTEIAESDGLTAAETALATRPQNAETAFVRGGLRFLMAVEETLQVRAANATGTLEVIPGFQFAVPANPDAMFDPAFLERALTGSLIHLAAAEAALGPATMSDFAAEVPIDALWLDINANKRREDWESLHNLIQTSQLAPNIEAGAVIRFDSADADWLAAYVHMISGINELVLSLDPTPAITEVYEGRQQLSAIANVNVGAGFIDQEDLDTLAAALLMLDGVPDKRRTRAALAHFQTAIHHNRNFWAEVAEETDNDREWLPNADQESAFGVRVSGEVGNAWQAVLAETSLVLEGERLLPYFGIRQGRGASEGYGINLASLLTEPGNFDAVLMIQGTTFAPHIEYGPLADMSAIRTFSDLTPGGSMLFAAWLN